MPKAQLISAIDIGTTKITTVIASVSPDREKINVISPQGINQFSQVEAQNRLAFNQSQFCRPPHFRQGLVKQLRRDVDKAGFVQIKNFFLVCLLYAFDYRQRQSPP